MISIHALLAESDNLPSKPIERNEYFYPRSPCGERHERYRLLPVSNHFYPRSPCGERLFLIWAARILPLFLSTLSLRRATLSASIIQSRFISYFYPRSPCGERPHALSVTGSESQFLSTLSLRRATPHFKSSWPHSCNFYPRSPCGERQRRFRGRLHVVDFYPRSPCGERRVKSFMRNGFFLISIHALLAESDADVVSVQHGRQNFYPRSPCGERLDCHCLCTSYSNFYPRSPCGERPTLPSTPDICAGHFYPRSPCGERPPRLSRVVPTPIFLSTLSLRRATF